MTPFVYIMIKLDYAAHRLAVLSLDKNEAFYTLRSENSYRNTFFSVPIKGIFYTIVYNSPDIQFPFIKKLNI